ncbi:hypothetical protein [Cetobacterium sp. 2G large]|uniref:hypothetical protein n=1 Tax=Cetobacterium sp. 2G large TaxID=2759680 RepID=UPI00163BB511|nr:hypothetical protein [Cetobacterium sp. 2G large]MBC2854460.1 hypothetical protein [Cetobacterium sp. 2G large]
MKKKLITLENVEEFIVGDELNMSKYMILLPKVNDYLKNKGVKIRYVSDSCKSLEERIKLILTKDFNISDERVIGEVLKKVKGGINNGY